MTILVIDGQGGKLGKTLVENIKKSFPHPAAMTNFTDIRDFLRAHCARYPEQSRANVSALKPSCRMPRCTRQ